MMQRPPNSTEPNEVAAVVTMTAVTVGTIVSTGRSTASSRAMTVGTIVDAVATFWMNRTGSHKAYYTS